MSQEFSCSGRVEYGMRGVLTSSWAWGRLETSPSQLRLSAPIFGEILFAPDDVVGLERFVRIPILSWGVKVRHIRMDVARAVHFLTISGPTALLKGIQESGFSPRATEQDQCLKCGTAMELKSDSCSQCGWSYRASRTGEA